MSLPQQILEVMVPETPYTPKQVSDLVHRDVDSVRKALNMMVKAMLLDAEQDDEYKRRKKYKNKQRRLF
jgi:predicted transcriptional regulator